MVVMPIFLPMMPFDIAFSSRFLPRTCAQHAGQRLRRRARKAAPCVGGCGPDGSPVLRGPRLLTRGTRRIKLGKGVLSLPRRSTRPPSGTPGGTPGAPAPSRRWGISVPVPPGGRDVWGGDVGGGNLGSRNPGEGAGWPCASSRGQPAPFAGTAPGLRLRRERRGRRAGASEAARPRRPGGEFRVHHGGGAGDREARGRARASV